MERGSEAIEHLRWDFDPAAAYAAPQEKWLQRWKPIIGFNPAHPPSHLHINQKPLDHFTRSRDAQAYSPDELRLAIGVPNPLAFLMSIAVWLR